MNIDTVKDELLAVANSGLKYALNKLPDADFELYLSQSSAVNVGIEGGMVSATDSLYSGTAVRVFNEKRKAFACTSGISLENLKLAIDEAISISKSISFVDERFHSLFTPNGHKISNEGIIDPEIANLNSKTIGIEANNLVKDCKIDERIVSISGYRTASYGAFAIVNSSGVEAASRNTVNVGQVEVVAKEGDIQKSSFDFAVSRDLKTFDLTKTGLNASKSALAQLQSKPLNKSDTITTLWDPIASALFIKTVFDFAISGKSVLEGDSYYADKTGDLIAPSFLNVIDDGQLMDALTTNAVDSEGVPTQKTTIVENGILKSFLSDSYYGHLLETSSTGNSKRMGNPTFEGLPGISPTTLTIKEHNTKTFQNLVGEIDYGVYIKGFLLGIGHTNPITGDMSAVSPETFLIENGEITHAIEPVNVAGNVYKNLKYIKMLGSDVLLTPFGVKTPSLVIDNFSITG